MTEQYEVPDTDSIYSPDEADAALKKFYGQVQSDPNHPYMNNQHPQSKDFRAAVTRLHEIKSPGDPDTNEEGQELVHQFSPDKKDAMREAFDSKDEKQRALVTEGEKLIEELEELGFEYVEVPDDVPEWKVNVWRMQKECAKENFDELESLISKELRGLKETNEVTQLFETFSQAKYLEPGVRQKLSEDIIEYIYRANQQKYSKKR